MHRSTPCSCALGLYCTTFSLFHLLLFFFPLSIFLVTCQPSGIEDYIRGGIRRWRGTQPDSLAWAQMEGDGRVGIKSVAIVEAQVEGLA